MTRTAPNLPLAIGLMLTATAFIGGTMLMAKLLGTQALGPPLHPLQIAQGRFLFAFATLVTVAAILRPRLGTPRPNLPVHVGRTVFGAGGVTFMFAAVAFIPMADATAISFLNPVFGMLLAIPFLGERIGRWRWLATVMALIGAVILLRPGVGTFQPAALLALTAALLMGFELIFIKKLADREPPFQILLINNALGLTLTTIAVLWVWVMPTPAQWGALAALGAMMAAAQACFVNAMARADASFVTPFSYLTLIFATLYDLFFFNVLPDVVSGTGAAIIVAGAILLAWREGVNRR
ncbi:DMT family transporter [Yoonia sp. 208BN28-4]|uniref:DMT family transporter n=1 Tax=Yoonia sp. 208BN28-4 TaxID=3126505 RepID=UPI00309A149F